MCNRVTGLLSPDPDGHVLAGALVYGSGRSDDFEDERRADSNRVGIENNAGLAAALAGVAQVRVCVCWGGWGVGRRLQTLQRGAAKGLHCATLPPSSCS